MSVGYGLVRLRPEAASMGQSVTTVRDYWLDSEKTACADTGANIPSDNDMDPSNDNVGQDYPEGYFSDPNRITLPDPCADDPNDPRGERAEPVAVVVPPAQAIPSTIPSYDSGTVICDGRQYNYGNRCPEPLSAAWAAGILPNAVQIRGAGAKILGTLHSEGGVTVSGSGNNVNSVETVIQPTIAGSGNVIKISRLVTLGGQTFQQSFNHDLAYRKVLIERAPLICPATGPLTINASALVENRAYDPDCPLIISGAGIRKKVTIGSQYPVTISGAGLTFDPAVPGYAAIYGEHVTISGANVRVNGSIQAYFDIKVTGAGSNLCGLVGDTIEISGAAATIQPCV
jgi:cytoskeletal protein CcmA (bactofilin family)